MPDLLAGRYEVGAVLGGTALTVMYRGRDIQLGRDVTVTLLRQELAEDEASVGLFTATISARAELSHPGIVGVYDVGEGEFGGKSVRWAVGEAVDAPNLDEFSLSAEQKPNWGATMLQLAEQVAQAMQHAHGDGVVHGNLGPSTVLIETLESGELRARITGFGPQAAELAVLSNPAVTQRMWQAFTEQLEYPSPEQRTGRAPTRRSDIYGFGCVLAALLLHAESARGGDGDGNDEGPVAARSVVLRSPAADPPREALVDIVEQAMSEKPSDRQHSFAVVLDQLRWIRSEDSLERRGETAPLGATAVEPTHTRVLPAPLMRGREPEPSTERLTYLSTRGFTRLRPGHPVPAVTVARAPRPRRQRSPGGRLFAGIAVAVLLMAGLGWSINQANSQASADSITIPSVTGQELGSATTLLGSLGLSLGGQVQRPDASVPVGLVAATEPAAGSQVQAGQSVTIVISTGPDARNVPQLQGLSIAAAQDALASAGLTAGEIVERDGLTAPGSVLESDPPFGTSVAAGAVVKIVVASGNQRVPRGLVGQAGLAASQQLASAGLAPQLLSQPRSDVATGVVIEVDPGEGTSIPLGSIVTLIVAEYTPAPADGRVPTTRPTTPTAKPVAPTPPAQPTSPATAPPAKQDPGDG